MPGLRNRHAYAITGVTERETNGVMHKYIVLQNPWGRVGRKYSNVLNQNGFANSTEVEDANFEVELSDFQRYFRGYTVGKIPFVPANSLALSGYQIATRQLMYKARGLETACHQFIKNLIDKKKNASTSQKHILNEQINIVNDARYKLEGINEHTTKSQLQRKISAFESIIFDKDNVAKLKQSNDGAGIKFLKFIAAILSLGLLYNRFFGKTHQKTFISEVGKERTAPRCS